MGSCGGCPTFESFDQKLKRKPCTQMKGSGQLTNSQTMMLLLFIHLSLYSPPQNLYHLCPYDVFENDDEHAGYPVFSQQSDLHYNTEFLSFFLHPDVDFSQVEYQQFTLSTVINNGDSTDTILNHFTQNHEAHHSPLCTSRKQTVRLNIKTSP